MRSILLLTLIYLCTPLVSGCSCDCPNVDTENISCTGQMDFPPNEGVRNYKIRVTERSPEYLSVYLEDSPYEFCVEETRENSHWYFENCVEGLDEERLYEAMFRTAFRMHLDFSEL